MRQRNYLNVILTVNAVLLAGLLWTQVADTPLLANSAVAQNRKQFAGVPTIPNAAKQRDAIAQGLRELKSSVEGVKRSLDAGVKVQVTNFDEVK